MNSEVTTGYILAAVFIAAGITFLLRLLPFGLKKALAGSELLDALSHWIPLGAVALLAIYAVAKINYSSFATAAPYLAGLVVTVGVHLWRKNMVLSMVAGTGTCVVLANIITSLRILLLLKPHLSRQPSNRLSRLLPPLFR